MGVADEPISESGLIIDQIKAKNGKSHVDQSSVSLSIMVHRYLENDCELESRGHVDYEYFKRTFHEAPCNLKDPSYSPQEEFFDVLQELILYNTDQELSIVEIVRMLIDTFNQDSDWICKANELNLRRGCLNRLIVQQLRNLGYNAAICKSRWDAVGWLPGGAHEYIDVYRDDSAIDSSYDRVIIDIEFSEQFEIARPTRQYRAVFELLPTLFVGRADRLEQILAIMCEAAKLSLKKKHIHLPPWRTLEYMQAKWFFSYTRDAHLLDEIDWSNTHDFCRSHATMYFHEAASRLKNKADVTGRISGFTPSRRIVDKPSKARDQDRYLDKVGKEDLKGNIHTRIDDYDVAAAVHKPPDKEARLSQLPAETDKPATYFVQSDAVLNEDQQTLNSFKKLPVETADLEEMLSKIRQKTLYNTTTLVYAD
ncbi:hypothetical protein O6H91_01G089200 [Diphasiastrum complanatum]|uniref:Uncharacterized protein n=2 Tax=Diphasiastrum complanatum TaxID=34168 RepID=A0ACC2ETE4_DIPCM|nr:hypothetical protein O6H91_01G089200 [Diphasiastrum complanatum]KAJ7569702.1 hypothetical protein O6H91_01G089200 [Diphasiastrum complanatum]